MTTDTCPAWLELAAVAQQGVPLVLIATRPAATSASSPPSVAIAPWRAKLARTRVTAARLSGVELTGAAVPVSVRDHVHR